MARKCISTFVVALALLVDVVLSPASTKAQAQGPPRPAAPDPLAAPQQDAPLGAGPFVPVYSVNTPNLIAPVPVRDGDRSSPILRSGAVELEITVGTDGRVRDAMVTKGVDGSLDALAVRAAANSVARTPEPSDGGRQDALHIQSWWSLEPLRRVERRRWAYESPS
jgi:hypothetical protein